MKIAFQPPKPPRNPESAARRAANPRPFATEQARQFSKRWQDDAHNPNH